jgi:hypothetical protein
MLAKICAGWLVVLILLPCTAPFPTCDVASLLGAAHQTVPISHHTSPVVATVNAAPSLVPHLSRMVGRVRLLPIPGGHIWPATVASRRTPTSPFSTSGITMTNAPLPRILRV